MHDFINNEIKKRPVNLQAAFKHFSNRLRHQHATIHMQGLACDVFRLFRRQKHHRIGDVLRFAQFAQGNVARQSGALLFWQGACHVGINEAWGDTIHRDATAAHFARQ